MTEVFTGNFAVVQDDTFKEHGISQGDKVYIAGETLVRVTEEDPYEFRKIFLAAFLKGKHIDLERKPFTIDGKRLVPVDEVTQKRLDKVRISDFKELDETPN